MARDATHATPTMRTVNDAAHPRDPRSPPPLGRWAWRALAAILLTALLARAAVLYTHRDNIIVSGFVALSVEMARVQLDEGRFASFDPEVLKALLHHRPYSLARPAPEVEEAVARSRRGEGTFEPSHGVDEGYSLLLAGLWSITGWRDLLVVRAFQGLLDILLVLLVFDSARRLAALAGAAQSAATGGLLAAGVLAVHLPHVRIAVNPWYTWWHVAAVVVTQWAFVRGATVPWRRAAATALAAAAANGITSWLRSMVLPLAVIPAFFLARVHRRGWVTVTMLVLAAAALAAGLVVPLALLRQRQWGETRFRRGTFWHTAYSSVRVRADGNPIGGDHVIMREIAERHGLAIRPSDHLLGEIQTPEYEAACRAEVLARVRENPGAVAAAWLKRVGLLCFTATQAWSARLPGWLAWLLEVPLYLVPPVVGLLVLRRGAPDWLQLGLGVFAPVVFSDAVAVLLAGVAYQFTLPGRVGNLLWLGLLPAGWAALVRRQGAVAA